MKKTLFFAAVCSLALFACQKDKDPGHPGQNGKSNKKLIVGKVWEIQKIKSAQSGVLYHYEKGGQNNNFDFSGYTLEFNSSGIGRYVAGSIGYDFTWQFTNAEQSELTYVIEDYANGQPAPGINHEVNLENITLTEDRFRYAEIYINENGASAVSSVYRIPLVQMETSNSVHH